MSLGLGHKHVFLQLGVVPMLCQYLSIDSGFLFCLISLQEDPEDFPDDGSAPVAVPVVNPYAGGEASKRLPDPDIWLYNF